MQMCQDDFVVKGALHRLLLIRIILIYSGLGDIKPMLQTLGMEFKSHLKKDAI